MGKMKYVLELALNHRADELQKVIQAAEAYDDKTVTFDGDTMPLIRAKGMYLIMKQYQDKHPKIND